MQGQGRKDTGDGGEVRTFPAWHVLLSRVLREQRGVFVALAVKPVFVTAHPSMTGGLRLPWQSTACNVRHPCNVHRPRMSCKLNASRGCLQR